MRTIIPDFLIIGAMKSGTTSLYNLLQRHNDISMCLVKEPNFFNLADDSGGNWELGVEWYRDLFISEPGLKGEASTSYTKFPSALGVPERIYNMNPNIRLIYIIRNPVDRAISHYLHRVVAGVEKRPIHAALKSSLSGYYLISMYFLQIQQYLAFFTREQICVITAEAMWADPRMAIDHVCDFLGLGRLPPHQEHTSKANVTRVKIQAQLSKNPLNEAQEQLWIAMNGGAIEENASAETFASELGFGADDRSRLASRLIGDVRSLRKFLGSPIEEWKATFRVD